MSRLFVVGPCPSWALPKAQPASARNVRSWQLLAPLLADGHEILLCITDIGGASPVGHGTPPSDSGIANLHWQVLPPGRGWRGRLRAACDRFAPDAVLAIMWQNSVQATVLPADLPFWADLFGYAIGEAQVTNLRAGDDRPPFSVIGFNERILQRCDVLSACSQRQAYAVIGELGMIGRLTAATTGYPFVHAILPGIAPAPGAPAAGHRARPDGDDALRLLWIGGYNAWTDVDTLFEGVSLALAACPELIFVSTGGKTIPPVDSVSYDRLLARIAASPHRDRFRMLGWVGADELAAQLAAAQIGIVVDAPHYETLLGTRTRLAEMLAYGIPVIATRGCELSEQIAAAGAGIVPPPGDPAALAEAILALARDPGRRAAAATAARHFSATALAPEVTTAPLRAWAAAPTRAPDHAGRGMGRLGRLGKWGLAWLRGRARLAWWDFFGKPV